MPLINNYRLWTTNLQQGSRLLSVEMVNDLPASLEIKFNQRIEHPAVVGFLDRNSRCKLVIANITYDAGLGLIPYTDQKFLSTGV